MINHIMGRQNDILKVLFWFNVVALAVTLFYTSQVVTWIIILVNIVCIGSFFIIKKYAPLFGILAETSKTMGQLNNVFGGLNG